MTIGTAIAQELKRKDEEIARLKHYEEWFESLIKLVGDMVDSGERPDNATDAFINVYQKMKAEIARLKEELEQRRFVGGMMSNICFNGKQRDSIPEDVRRCMRECQERWDQIKSGE